MLTKLAECGKYSICAEWRAALLGNILSLLQHDNHSLPSERVSFSQGNMTIKLLQKSDFGYYECVARNSVATIVTSTQVGWLGMHPGYWEKL